MRARLVRHVRGRVHLLPVAITQRLAQICHGVNQPAYLCDEWLCLNRGEQPFPQRMGQDDESKHRTDQMPAAWQTLSSVVCGVMSVGHRLDPPCPEAAGGQD